MDLKTFLLGLLSYAIVGFGAHFLVMPFVKYLWKKAYEGIGKKESDFEISIKPHKTISFWYGVIERIIFASCFIISRPEGIAIWLAFKAVVRWKMSEEKDERHIPGSPIYMIGTAINIFWGFIGALIVYNDFSFLNRSPSN